MVFNSVLQCARFLPIIACVQSIFYRITKYNFKHQDKVEKWKDNRLEFPKKVVDRVTHSQKKSRVHEVRPFPRVLLMW